MAAKTNDHQLGSLKQHTCVILPSWSQNPKLSPRAKLRVGRALLPAEAGRGPSPGRFQWPQLQSLFPAPPSTFNASRVASCSSGHTASEVKWPSPSASNLCPLLSRKDKCEGSSGALDNAGSSPHLGVCNLFTSAVSSRFKVTCLASRDLGLGTFGGCYSACHSETGHFLLS